MVKSQTHIDYLEYFLNKYKKQNKIKSVSDLLPDMMYSYQCALDGLTIGEIILWIGLLYDKNLFDSQINITLKQEIKLYHHKKNTSLWSITSWEEDNGQRFFEQWI